MVVKAFMTVDLVAQSASAITSQLTARMIHLLVHPPTVVKVRPFDLTHLLVGTINSTGSAVLMNHDDA